MADFKSEWPRSNRNQWPTLFRNRWPTSPGIRNRTVLDEFYRVVFRKKIYRTIDELQTDLDAWITEYNRASEHPSVYAIEGNRLC